MDFTYQADNTGNSEPQNDFGNSHTATLIKAASPYFDPDTQRSLHFLASIYEVMDSVQLLSKKKTVSALSFSMKNVDLEGLLKGIRPVCNSQEQSLVDKFLNMFNMKRMFETYQMMSSMMSMFNQDSSSNDQAMNNAFYQSMNSSPFPEENKYNNESLHPENNFDYVDDFIYDNNPNPIYNQQKDDYLEAAQMNSSNTAVDDDKYKQTGQQNTQHNSQSNSQQTFGEKQNSSPFQQQDQPLKQNQDDTSKDNSQSMNTQQMMDMLGTMLSPEQKNTFESMKMLFNSGMFNS